MKPLKRNYKLVIILGVLFLQNSILAQSVNLSPVVAWVGSESITAKEFMELYEFNPQLNSINNSTSFFSKLNFLYTVISYKLWNQNKDELGVNSSLAYRTANEEIKKLFVRDALYRRNILDKIFIRKEELEAGLIKQKQNLIIDYIFAEKENEAYNIHNLLKAGFPFDTLMNSTGKSEMAQPVEIKFGDFNEFVENQLYALKVDDFMQPIQFDDGYYIYHLKNIIKKVWNGDKNDDDDAGKVKDILYKRKEIEIYNSYMRSVLNGLNVDVDRKLFAKLTGELERIYLDNIDKHLTDKEYFHLTNDEFITLESKFTNEELKLPFISFLADTISSQQYLRAFFFNGIKFPKTYIKMESLLDSYVRDFIVKEKLYQTGIAEGLDTLTEVRKYESLWSEYYAYETAKGNIMDTVDISMEEIQSEISSNRNNSAKQEWVKLDYLYLKDSTLMQNINLEIEEGISFDYLKKKYSDIVQNEFFSDSSSWIPLNMCGDFAEGISKLYPGESLDPFKWDSSFVVIKLNDRKLIDIDSSSYTDKLSIEEVKERLIAEKINEQLVNATFNFASRTPIRIDYEILNSLEVTKINSFAIRYIGFGGSITGTPIYSPNYEWARKLNESRKNLP